MDKLLEFIKDFDVHTLIGLSIVFWYFTRNIRNEIKEEIKGIRQEIQEIRESSFQQSKRTDRLYEMFCDMQREIKDIRCDGQREIKDLYLQLQKREG